MQIVILAGGLGTRLRPITEHVPKPMVEIAGRPFLEYIIRWLGDQHFNRVLLLLGYLGEQVEEYFGDGDRFGLNIDYGREPTPLGTAGALRNNIEKLDPQFLLLYGDSFLPIEYRKVISEFRRMPCRGLLVVYDNRYEDTGVMNNVAMDVTGRVLRYEKGTGTEGLNFVEAGVLCLCRDVFVDLEPHHVISLEQEIFPRLIADGELRAMATQQRFFDIGTPDRLREFSSVFA